MDDDVNVVAILMRSHHEIEILECSLRKTGAQVPICQRVDSNHQPS